MKTAVEILKAARAVIEKPESWTKGYYAKAEDRTWTISNGPKAVCFCSIGAIEKATGKVHYGGGWPFEAEYMLRRAADVSNIADFNDAPERTHEEVLAIFDRAIELAVEESA